MRIVILVSVVALALFSSAVGLAEEPMAPPQPTAEHKELGMWVGGWSGTGEMKPGPFGPGGPMSSTIKMPTKRRDAHDGRADGWTEIGPAVPDADAMLLKVSPRRTR